MVEAIRNPANPIRTGILNSLSDWTLSAVVYCSPFKFTL
jgi:hypothetical protein